jgi:SLT domain-containing protein
MIGKLKWLVGFGAGYVLGARAGRERYDQIAGKAQEMWSDPRVQAKADQAQQLVMEKADQAQQVVKEKVWERTSGNGSGAGSRAASGASTSSGTTRSQTSPGSRSGAGTAKSS